MKRILKLSVLALALASAGGSQAALLSTLFAGASITAGDKVFDSWSLGSFLSGELGRTFNAANIDVTALNDGGLNPGPGLAFSVLNNEFSVTGDNIYNYVSLDFGFRVTAPAGLSIKDVSLALTDGLVTSPGDNGMYISESVGTTAGGSDLGLTDVELSYNGSTLTSNLSGSANFAPQSSIWVTKSILVFATNDIETASLTGFEQRYSQQRDGVTPVSTPGTLSLAALALLGAVVGRRRAAATA